MNWPRLLAEDHQSESLRFSLVRLTDPRCLHNSKCRHFGYFPYFSLDKARSFSLEERQIKKTTTKKNNNNNNL